jgi:hypothetical protein
MKWILYHDNAPYQTTHSIKQFLAKKPTAVFDHYSNHLISPRMTFSCSCKYKSDWNGLIFNILKINNKCDNSTKCTFEKLFSAMLPGGMASIQ